MFMEQNSMQLLEQHKDGAVLSFINIKHLRLHCLLSPQLELPLKHRLGLQVFSSIKAVRGNNEEENEKSITFLFHLCHNLPLCSCKVVLLQIIWPSLCVYFRNRNPVKVLAEMNLM